MTEEQLREIEERANRTAPPCRVEMFDPHADDTLALIAEVRRLKAKAGETEE